MRSLFRVVAATFLPLLALSVLVVAGFASTPVLAQSDAAQDQPGQSTAPEEPETDQAEEEMSPKDRKQDAKEKRIQEYLRKREERRAEKEMNRRSRETQQAEAEAREMEKRQLAAQEEAERESQRAAAGAEPSLEPIAAPDKKATRKRAGRPVDKSSRLPRGLARAQANIRATELALDPTVEEYLVLIDQQGASAHELAAFGSFIAQNGMVREAL